MHSPCGPAHSQHKKCAPRAALLLETVRDSPWAKKSSKTLCADLRTFALICARLRGLRMSTEHVTSSAIQIKIAMSEITESINVAGSVKS